MMAASGWRDHEAVDAMTTDRYLDALLSAHASGAERAPSSSGLDAAVRAAAERLSRDLPRLHPSFRFEEALWLRLSDVARGIRLGAVAGGDAAAIPMIPADPDLAALVGGPDRTGDPAIAVHPLLVGGGGRLQTPRHLVRQGRVASHR